MLLGQKEESDSIWQLSIEHQHATEALLSRLHDLQNEYDGLVEINYQREVQAREEKSNLQAQFAQMKQEHAVRMDEKAVELSTLESALTEETIEYNELKEYFDAVDKQLAKEAHEQSLMQSFRQVQECAEKELYEAVRMVQKMARGWKARLTVKAMKAKKTTACKGKGKVKGKNNNVKTTSKLPPKTPAKKK